MRYFTLMLRSCNQQVGESKRDILASWPVVIEQLEDAELHAFGGDGFAKVGASGCSESDALLPIRSHRSIVAAQLRCVRRPSLFLIEDI